VKLLNNIVSAFKRFDKFITDAVILFYEDIIKPEEDFEKQIALLKELNDEKFEEMNKSLNKAKTKEEQQQVLRKYGVII